MWLYLLLGAGIFMGWSLGTNDAANAFGTAVATGVVKYRTAIIIIAVMVVSGAFLQGEGNLQSVVKLATGNAVIPSETIVKEQIAAGNQSWLDSLVWKSALKAALVFVISAVVVFIMSYLKFPVSANQSITGAIIGWGLANGCKMEGDNLKQIIKFASTWVMSPVGAIIISFILITLTNKLLLPRLSKLSNLDKIVKIGYIIAGAYGAYSIGRNSSANVTALYYGATVDGVQTNLLSNAQLTATIGGIAIAIGVLTYSKKVMMTVGSSIAPLTQVEGFVVIIAMSLTITLMGDLMQIPVSTSQAVVGAVVGAGLTKGWRCVNFGVFKNIAIAWVSSPVAAGLVAFVVALATKGIFA